MKQTGFTNLENSDSTNKMLKALYYYHSYAAILPWYFNE
jgi:hypothetical protein